ncbi:MULTISPECIES: hypothetical protein [unclassified Bradyrhizobium]|uniref:hypothetical protein n=1 Tax=unclassified Bradyrhizobium TaxID=2631580 RepID=UPI0015CD0099|nr:MULTISPECIES: hypothetical protein [unclassified Bradyrhizobium]MBB4261552.1 hypothetical protein [Bradyrhizobium sp. CIR3A]NYG46423.1 hypothetical protein [Bradyrhizobium sp. IAR9]
MERRFGKCRCVDLVAGIPKLRTMRNYPWLQLLFVQAVEIESGSDRPAECRSMVWKTATQERTLKPARGLGAKVQVAAFGAGANRVEIVADFASRVAERAAETNDEDPIVASATSTTPKIRLRI